MCSEFLRFKFTKEEEFKYLSHLDLVRIIYRSLVRAGLKLSYSGGFNPKPKITFSNPTPLGIESLAEYCDVELIEKVSEPEFIAAIKRILPRQIKVIGAKIIRKESPKLMSIISTILYRFYLVFDKDEAKSFFEINIKNKLNNENKVSLIKFKSLDIERLNKDFRVELEKNYQIFNSIYNFNFYSFNNKKEDLFEKCDKNCVEKYKGIVLDVFGYAKIFKDKDNFIFKFYSFLDFLKNFLNKFEEIKMDIKSFKKIEMYINIGSRLVTPLDIV